MSETSAALESLMAYCKAADRMVPMPQQWQRLYDLLPDKRKKPSGGREPPVPLILGAWYYTSGLEKVLRFQEHLRWAEAHGVLDEVDRLLRALGESDWCHWGEH